MIGIPVGGVVGGLIGAFGGGIGGAGLAKAAADRMVDDDSRVITLAISEEMQELASEYMLTEADVERVGMEAGRVLNAKSLRRLFKRSRKGADRDALAREIRREFEPVFEKVARERPRVALPSPVTVDSEVLLLVEAAASTEDAPVV